MIHGVAGRRFSFRHGGDKVIGVLAYSRLGLEIACGRERGHKFSDNKTRVTMDSSSVCYERDGNLPLKLSPRRGLKLHLEHKTTQNTKDSSKSKSFHHVHPFFNSCLGPGYPDRCFLSSSHTIHDATNSTLSR